MYVSPESFFGRAHIPNATYQVLRPFAYGFQKKKILKGFYLIWVWGHLGHVTINIGKKCPFLNLRRLHMKIDFNQPGGFWEKNI